MLAKQLWRILQQPSSLSAKIIKAKYIPNLSPFEAVLPRNVSYAWKVFFQLKPYCLKFYSGELGMLQSSI